LASIFDLFEVTSISENTTYSLAAGNLLGVVDDFSSTELDDGEFDEGDIVQIGGVSYTIDLIQEPQSSGSFTLGDGSTQSFDPGAESNLDVIFLTVSDGSDVRYFIVPNDSYGDMNVQSIRTGQINDVAGNDAALVSKTDDNVNVVCFVTGSAIETPDGPVPIEDLKAGDRVSTYRHGPQVIRMILVRTLDLAIGSENLKPIAFEPDSLGPGRPTRRLCVSPQHRMLVADASGNKVLVPAKSLTALKGVRVMKGKRKVTYFHLVFDRHEIIMSNGILTESFFPGPMALAYIPKSARDEICELFGMDVACLSKPAAVPAAPVYCVQESKKNAHVFKAVLSNEITEKTFHLN